MTVLRANNRQDKVLFNKGGKGYRFNVCITNLFTSATKENVKLDGAYINTYNSQKYSNLSEIKDVTFTPSSYITFNFNDFEERDNNCSVFVSFPHLDDLQEFIGSMYDMMFGNEYFSKKNTVPPSKKDSYISSEPMGSEKQLVVSPVSVRVDNGNERGCIFSLYDPEQDLQYGNLTLSEREVLNMYSVLLNIDNISLQLMTDNLCIMSMLALGAGSGSGDEEESSGGARPARRGLGGKRTPSRRKPSARRNIRESMNSEPDEEEDDLADLNEEETEYVEDAKDAVFDTGDDEEEEKPVKKTSKKKSTKKENKKSSSSSSKKKNPKKLSMEEILDEAEEMEYDEDDDIDFDEDEE